MFENIKDEILLISNDKSERLIFNYHSFLSIIYGIMTHYLRFKPTIALEKINYWLINSMPNINYDKVALLGHELEYDWAMLIAYGHSYSQLGYNSKPPEDFWQWQNLYISKNNLKPICIDYLD